MIRGAAGMAGELGHIQIPMDGLLVPGQPVPRCNCGFVADLESVASLSGIANNLLPFWLTRYPDHPLADVAVDVAAKQVRDYGERGDELAQRIFDQQAMAIGRMFTIAANFVDPDAYFIGGGVTDTSAEFRTRFVERVQRRHSSATSRPRSPRSPSSPISTWPVPAAPHWQPCGQSAHRTSDRADPRCTRGRAIGGGPERWQDNFTRGSGARGLRSEATGPTSSRNHRQRSGNGTTRRPVCPGIGCQTWGCLSSGRSSP